MDAQNLIRYSIHIDWDEENFGILTNTASESERRAFLQRVKSDKDIQTLISLELPTTNDSPQAKSADEDRKDDMTELPKAYVNIEPMPDYDDNAGQLTETSQSPQPSDSTKLGSSAHEDGVPTTFWGNNEFGDVSVDNIVEEPRRPCNHATVLEYAKVHKTTKEVPLEEAIQGPNGAEWVEAINKEVTALEHNTVSAIDPTDALYTQAVANAVPSRIILTEKRDGRKKARWIVQGCFESKDYDDPSNHSHVATLNSVRCCVFRGDRRARTLASVDIRTAFLQSDRYQGNDWARYIKVRDISKLSEHTYKYYLLLGPMYGQRSAPIRWENTVVPFLVEEGFHRGENELCVFHRTEDDLTLVLYVDDILLDGDHASVTDFLNKLAKRFDINEPVYLSKTQPIDFVGIIISMDENQIHLSMEEYHTKLLDSMGMANCRPLGTPFEGQITDTTPLSGEQTTLYRQGIGGIGWLANTIRPDLAYSFSRLGQHLANPSVGAMEALKRTLRYISGTKNFSLSTSLDTNQNTWEFYCDSDHGGNAEANNQRKSQTGFVALLNGAPVLWKSTVQSCSAISSTEAEIYAASTAVQSFMHLSYVANELGLTDFPSPFILQMDNAAAEIFLNNSTSVSRLKHIDCREQWVKHMRDRTVVQAQHVPTDRNLADIFTKGLTRPSFSKFANQLQNQH